MNKDEAIEKIEEFYNKADALKDKLSDALSPAYSITSISEMEELLDEAKSAQKEADELLDELSSFGCGEVYDEDEDEDVLISYLSDYTEAESMLQEVADGCI